MGRKIITGCLICCFLINAMVSCNDRKVTRGENKDKFDMLENIVGNDNWLIVDGQDSSYLYFSRLGSLHFKTYGYSIVKGDSANSIVTDILCTGNSISWRLPFKDSTQLFLDKAGPGAISWKDRTGRSFTVQKKDSTHLYLALPGIKKMDLVKTITLSAFLVKNKYDYQHGTHLGFENFH